MPAAASIAAFAVGFGIALAFATGTAGATGGMTPSVGVAVFATTDGDVGAPVGGWWMLMVHETRNGTLAPASKKDSVVRGKN